jgi:3-oxoacyl-[acyl-carrier protein] reductase
MRADRIRGSHGARPGAAGASVALMSRAREDLDAVAAERGRQAAAALPVPVDLADASALGTAANGVLQRFGRIDVLVHAAGTDAPGPVAELDTTGWDRVLAVNLRAGFLLAKLAWPGMERERRPRSAPVSGGDSACQRRGSG